MHYTGEITLGNIATVVTLITLAIGVGRRLGSFEATISSHADRLAGVSARLDKYEQRLFDLAGKE